MTALAAAAVGVARQLVRGWVEVSPVRCMYCGVVGRPAAGGGVPAAGGGVTTLRPCRAVLGEARCPVVPHPSARRLRREIQLSPIRWCERHCLVVTHRDVFSR